MAQNTSTFQMMTELFKKKWHSLEPNFIDYFQREWLGSHCNWFEGVADYTPSTNNALESHNSIIKRTITFRKRLPLNQFLISMTQMTKQISIQFSSGQREISTEPTISKKVMTDAAELTQTGFKAFKAKSGNASVLVYSIPSSICDNPSEKYYKTLVNRKWKSFDEFVTYGFQQFWVVQFSLDDWKCESKCTCPIFFKYYMCKHVVACGYREGVIECPNEAIPTLLTTRGRRGKGRAPNSKGALLKY